MQDDVAYNMYPVLDVYKPTHTNFALTSKRWSLLSILVKTARVCCKQLQNDGALNSVQFFLDHSIYSDS